LDNTVATVLANPRIAGMRAYNGEIVADGIWEPIIDRFTFEQLQAKIKRVARPRRPATKLLTGIARCGRCGCPLWSSTGSDSRNGNMRYACVKRPGSPGCGATTIVSAPLDELVTDAVLHRLNSKAMARALSRKPKAKPVDVDLVRIERDLEDLASDFGQGRISRREWLAARGPLEDRLARAQRSSTRRPVPRRSHPSATTTSQRRGRRSRSNVNAPS
jgi:site-specific DNA recombinase